MRLSDDAFKNLIKNGILLSIDLIIKNKKNEVLIGLRKNNPAAGYWFVPGGRVYKNETFNTALERICRSEVGELQSNYTYNFKGLYNHIYNDNFFNDPDFNTHYVVVGIELHLGDIEMKNSMLDQHADLKFISIPSLLNDENVHKNTQYYFVENAPNRFI